MPVNYEQIRADNEALLADLESPGIEKRAESALTGFIRTKLREDSVLDRLIEPVQVPAGKLTKRVHDDKPYMVLEKEPNSPAAMSIPFGESPMGYYLKGNRYELFFNRLITRKFFKDVAELHSYDMDLRQVVSDNSVRDMMAEKDSKFITAVEAGLGDAANTVLDSTSTIQWKEISGGVGRDTLLDAIAIMPATPSRLVPTRAVCNNLFIYQVMKQGRDEAGGDIAQDWLKNGWSSMKFMGLEWLISIKHDIFPNNRIYYFSENDFLGKHFFLEEVTMSVERKAYILSWFTYACYGASIANVSGLAIADFIN
jgi:hypothetical protein